jgi:hypothetical protein
MSLILATYRRGVRSDPATAPFDTSSWRVLFVDALPERSRSRLPLGFQASSGTICFWMSLLTLSYLLVLTIDLLVPHTTVVLVAGTMNCLWLIPTPTKVLTGTDV